MNGVNEPAVGTLAFESVGTLAFTDVAEAARDFPAPPGHAKLVATSSRYGLTCFADPRGLYAIPTAALAAMAEALAEKLAAEQVKHSNIDFKPLILFPSSQTVSTKASSPYPAP
jgi:nuclear pore complex protein Nup214